MLAGVHSWTWWRPDVTVTMRDGANLNLHPPGPIP